MSLLNIPCERCNFFEALRAIAELANEDISAEIKKVIARLFSRKVRLVVESRIIPNIPVVDESLQYHKIYATPTLTVYRGHPRTSADPAVYRTCIFWWYGRRSMGYGYELEYMESALHELFGIRVSRLLVDVSLATREITSISWR